MKIVVDTATLFAPAEGAEQGMTVIPVCVNINDKTYVVFVSIGSGSLDTVRLQIELDENR